MATRKRKLDDSSPFADNRSVPALMQLVDTMIGENVEEGGESAGRSLVVGEDGAIRIGNLELSRVGIIDHGATVDEWVSLGLALHTMRSSLDWLIADYMDVCERVHGQTYDEVADILGVETKTLYNRASVARKVDISRRREDLSFSHHALVAALPPEWQNYWLGQAIHQGWSRRTMENAIKQYPNGLPEDAALATVPIAALPAPKDPLEKFDRVLDQFMDRVTKIQRGAGQSSRTQMAQKLREIADRLERGE